MELLTFEDNFLFLTKLMMFNIICIVGSTNRTLSHISLRIKVYTLVFITKLMDKIDIALQKMGIKLMPLKIKKILDSLSEEEKAEIQSEDVLDAFNVYVKVRYIVHFLLFLKFLKT